MFMVGCVCVCGWLRVCMYVVGCVYVYGRKLWRKIILLEPHSLISNRSSSLRQSTRSQRHLYLEDRFDLRGRLQVPLYRLVVCMPLVVCLLGCLCLYLCWVTVCLWVYVCEAVFFVVGCMSLSVIVYVCAAESLCP